MGRSEDGNEPEMHSIFLFQYTSGKTGKIMRKCIGRTGLLVQAMPTMLRSNDLGTLRALIRDSLRKYALEHGDDRLHSNDG
jgi:hypothetical protein